MAGSLRFGIFSLAPRPATGWAALSLADADSAGPFKSVSGVGVNFLRLILPEPVLLRFFTFLTS